MHDKGAVLAIDSRAGITRGYGSPEVVGQRIRNKAIRCVLDSPEVGPFRWRQIPLPNQAIDVCLPHSYLHTSHAEASPAPKSAHPNGGG